MDRHWLITFSSAVGLWVTQIFGDCSLEEALLAIKEKHQTAHNTGFIVMCRSIDPETYEQLEDEGYDTFDFD